MFYADIFMQLINLNQNSYTTATFFGLGTGSLFWRRLIDNTIRLNRPYVLNINRFIRFNSFKCLTQIEHNRTNSTLIYTVTVDGFCVFFRVKVCAS